MSQNLTPKQLADELGINPKNLRNYLRKNFTRVAEVKNTAWSITPDAANAARAHFKKQEA